MKTKIIKWYMEFKDSGKKMQRSQEKRDCRQRFRDRFMRLFLPKGKSRIRIIVTMN